MWNGYVMRKIILAVTLISTLIFSASICAAKDIWVDHRQSEGLDIYVMDDTITAGDNRDYFSVSTKMIKNGNLSQVVVWKFSKYGEDMWRYETDAMDGTHTTVVIPQNKVFEYCMNRLGWSYKIVDNMWYY